MRRKVLFIYSYMAVVFGCVFYFNPGYGDKIFIDGTVIGIIMVGIGIITALSMVFKNPKVDQFLFFSHAAILGALTTESLIRYAEGATNVIWVFTTAILAYTILLIMENKKDG